MPVSPASFQRPKKASCPSQYCLSRKGMRFDSGLNGLTSLTVKENGSEAGRDLCCHIHSPVFTCQNKSPSPTGVVNITATHAKKMTTAILLKMSRRSELSVLNGFMSS